MSIRGLKQRQKFLNCHSGIADKGAESAYRELVVLGNRKIHAQSRFRHYEMASHLSSHFPTCFLESFGRFFPEMFASRATRLDRDEDFALF